MHAIAMLGMVLAAAAAPPNDPLTVAIPEGLTPLGDIGLYHVGYQSYEGETVEMPLSWVGHFDARSGISYLPTEPIQERTCILLHSPWKVSPGRAWVDYRLALPEVSPIVLKFGIAMRKDMVIPGRSDGVTFGCYIIADGTERELMRLHHKSGEWRDFSFDLSAWAGKTATLRLQVEPGPDNSPSWDYSYFGDPRIKAGHPGQERAAQVERLTSSRAYHATVDVDLRSAANRSGEGVTPSNLLPHRNRIEPRDGGYAFIYEGDDCRLKYVYTPETGTLNDFAARLNGDDTVHPMWGGGVTVDADAGGQHHRVIASGGEAREAALTKDGTAVRVVWEYADTPVPLTVEWTFGIRGKALTIEARSGQPVISDFSLGQCLARFRKVFSVPYLHASVVYLADSGLHTCRCLDWTVSHASVCPEGYAGYHKKTDGARNTLYERGYVALSPSVHEVLPNIPHPPSPYLALLGPRIMLDIWGHHEGTYQGDAKNLRDLKDNGVDALAIISHVWQRYGYDVKLPDHLPANPQFGGDEGMIEFGKAANECDYIWSLHENYIDIYPDAPSYDAADRVLREDGSPSPAWFNEGTGVQSYGLKCNRALHYAQQNSPEIHKRFNTSAAYLDVHTCVPPWHQLDHDATQPMAAMALGKVRNDSALFQYMRDTHGGPLFGEGNDHFYWAGLVDGAEAQVDGGEHHQAFLDFDLLKLHPQMVNHGMGYYERWFELGYSTQWGFHAGAPYHVDKYRAQEVAYGHAGFIGNAVTDNVHWVVKEHHLMNPIQRLTCTAKATQIMYEVDGEFVTASVALAMGQRERQRIRYDSGATVWVNWAETPWRVEGRVLPQWGFLAMGPETEVSTSLMGNSFADFADCPDFTFVDARTYFNMPYLRNAKNVEPVLDSFEYLGGNRIRLSYLWKVNDTFDEDLNCFVHFTNEGLGRHDIAFQNDHPLPKSTREWKVGEELRDGPHEIGIPAEGFDTYDLVTGLFRDARYRLKGVQAGGNRVLLGRLEVKREGNKITDIAFTPVQDLPAEQAPTGADFTAHMNPAGTWLDFGKIATDGSVKVNKGHRRLTVFPYPRDKAFRVALDLDAFAKRSPVTPGNVEIRALAAGTREDMGVVPHRFEGNRFRFDAGVAGAGRYIITW